jgi:hypothetical protein
VRGSLWFVLRASLDGCRVVFLSDTLDMLGTSSLWLCLETITVGGRHRFNETLLTS